MPLRTIAPSYEEPLVKLRVGVQADGFTCARLPRSGRAVRCGTLPSRGVRSRSPRSRRPANHLLSVPGLRNERAGQPHSAFACDKRASTNSRDTPSTETAPAQGLSRAGVPRAQAGSLILARRQLSRTSSSRSGLLLFKGPFLCSTPAEPFLRPDRKSHRRRAQPLSRLARRATAGLGLDKGEHGATLGWLGRSTSVKPPASRPSLGSPLPARRRAPGSATAPPRACAPAPPGRPGACACCRRRTGAATTR